MTGFGDRHAPVSVFAMGEIRNATGEDVVTMRAHQLSNRWQRASEIALTQPRVEIARAAA
jgi:hypothetical protein